MTSHPTHQRRQSHTCVNIMFTDTVRYDHDNLKVELSADLESVRKMMLVAYLTSHSETLVALNGKTSILRDLVRCEH
jgi:hypothetical protein